MTIVLVHGVPEDAQLWDDLRKELGTDDVIALGLPGFAGTLPAGFAATKEGYEAWLARELAGLPGPIDLVGHDWGGILTTRLALTRPELIRSFATDAIGFMHPGFVWHDLAKLWATPGAGEKFMTDQAAAPIDAVAARFVSMGVAPHYARHLAEVNPVRNQCILELYRSSTTIHTDWAAGGKTFVRPGLFVYGDKDPFVVPANNAELVAQLHVTATKALPGAGHFWPSQVPAAGAAALREFWATL